MSLNKNLTLSEREIIQTGITNGSSKRSIAETIGKDESTIAKEIRLHRFISYKSSLTMECANYKHCIHKRKCSETCSDFIKFKCKRRDRTPGACNGCQNISSCRFTKYRYEASRAEHLYRQILVESREGFDITEEEIDKMSEIVCPLLLQGQSPYVIIQNHPELGITERTLYTYIEAGLFKKNNVSVMDLRRYVSRKMTKKKKNEYKKRQDRKYLINRTYNDFKAYMKLNPDATVVEMDTVYNDVSNGPFMQTFKFLDYGFLFAIYHTKKNEDSMVEGVNLLYKILGEELFKKYVQIIKGDRGSEFQCPERFEADENGELRCLVYYCDPMMSCQKGSLENNHEELRYFFPKEEDLTKYGLISQEYLNKVLSNINSTAKEKLKGKTPIELMKFYAPDLYQKFNDFGIKLIPADQVILNTSLNK